MQAKHLMQRDVVKVREDDSVADLIETLVREHLHGAPVLDGSDALVGVVTQQDIFFSAMTLPGDRKSSAKPDHADLRVRDIMTAPAVFAHEETEVRKLCQLMERLRIHRIPIVRDDRVTGIVSSLDICGAVARGETLS